MDNYVYNVVDQYFNTLKKLGYMKQKSVDSLLVLIFYYNLIYNDYRGYISKEDYEDIERALNCLYGTNCLIPYPDYLKMGKLKLGEMTEVLSRTKAVEEYSKELDQRILDNDVLIEDNIRRLDEHGHRLVEIEKTKVIKSKNHIINIPDIILDERNPNPDDGLPYDHIPDVDPEPLVHVVKTYDNYNYISNDLGINDSGYAISFDDILNVYQLHDNCSISCGDSNETLYCFTFSYEGELEQISMNIENLQYFNIGHIAYIPDLNKPTGSVTLPYKFSYYDIQTMMNYPFPYGGGQALLLIDKYSRTSNLKLTYTE